MSSDSTKLAAVWWTVDLGIDAPASETSRASASAFTVNTATPIAIPTVTYTSPGDKTVILRIYSAQSAGYLLASKSTTLTVSACATMARWHVQDLHDVCGGGRTNPSSAL